MAAGPKHPRVPPRNRYHILGFPQSGNLLNRVEEFSTKELTTVDGAESEMERG